MPCQGPSNEEVRTANHQRDLYQLMLDIHHYGKDNGAGLLLTSEYFAMCEQGIAWAKGAMSDSPGFDRATAELCRIVQAFTPEQQDFYLYNGRVSACRRLAEWWEAHQEVDRQRVERDKERVAREIAQQAARDAYRQAMGEINR